MTESALDFALAAYQRPARLRMGHDAHHPDILTLIKIAAGDTETTRHWASHYTIPEANLLEACVFYLRSMIATAGADPFRLLCLKPNATLEEFTAHKRWLLRWLHPDRNTSVWESSLFTRVAHAAKLLEAQLRKSGAPVIEAAPEFKPAFDRKTVRFTAVKQPQHHMRKYPALRSPRQNPPRRASSTRNHRLAVAAAIAVLSMLAFLAGRWSFAPSTDLSLTNISWHG